MRYEQNTYIYIPRLATIYALTFKNHPLAIPCTCVDATNDASDVKKNAQSDRPWEFVVDK